jgi:hypothetical protein
MDHTTFKKRETAFAYVAGGLEGATLAAFKLHVEGCPECAQDVEGWRAIKQEMPERVLPPRRAARGQGVVPPLTWPLATVFIGVVFAFGAAIPLCVNKLTGTRWVSAHTVVFEFPDSRDNAKCAAVAMAPDTQAALTRVPRAVLARGGATQSGQVVALDSEKHALPDNQYTSSAQPDGSQLFQIDSQLLMGRAVHLSMRYADGYQESLGCITGEMARHEP